MALEIHQDEAGPVRVLTLGGRLDTETAADLELALQDLRAAGDSQFLLDLTGIGYVSSAGLRVLLGLAKQLDGGKGSLRLCGLSAAVRQVFEVAGFSKLFAIFPNRDAALSDIPRVTPEQLLAQKAAKLLGIAAPAGAKPAAAMVELARATALLLGVKPVAAAKDPSLRMAASSIATSAFERQRLAMAQKQQKQAPAGFLAKLRAWFGGKR